MNMKLKIRKFNQKGNEIFSNFVKNSKREFTSKKKSKFKTPINIINDKSLTEPINLAGEIDVNKTFENAFEYAVYINDKIKDIDLKKYRWDDGLFNWISAALFPNFFPGIRSGIDEKRVFLSDVSKSKWRRHFARTLWEIYHVYGEASLCLLFKETNNFSDELETVSKSPIMFSCKGIVEAYSDMYFKKEKGNTGKQTYKRGEVADFRNFIDELYQLELNLDIFRMSKDQIIAKLNVAFNDRVKKNK